MIKVLRVDVNDNEKIVAELKMFLAQCFIREVGLRSKIPSAKIAIRHLSSGNRCAPDAEDVLIPQ